MLAVTIVDQTTLSNLVPYAAPLAAIIFVTLGFLTPLLSGVTSSMWLAAIPVAIAVVLGIGLFGRGNVASGELGLDDLPRDTSTTTTAGTPGSTQATTTTATLEGAIAIPEDLAPSYAVATGLATYSVEETLRGLATVAVGTTESISGSIVPVGPFTFTIDLQSFVSDQSQRDGRVRGWFAEHPEGTFAGDSFSLPDEATVGEVVAFDITGDMTINEITEPVTWSIEARVEPDATLTITGEAFIVLSDFDVPVFTGGFVEMEDGATLEVVFSARPEG
jgi:polyisoprenoid-binding protein YceI